MHVRKNAAFPRFDIKKYVLVIREIESICRRTALEPIIYEVCVTLIIKCIARVSNPDDTAILDCTYDIHIKKVCTWWSVSQLLCSISLKNLFETHFVYLLVVSYSHPWAWHKICKIVFLVETWTNVTYVA